MFEKNPLKSNAARSAEVRESGQANDATSINKPQYNERSSTLAMIGSSIHIKGDVSGEENLVIQGRVEGNVDLKHNKLIIGQDGNVTATVHAHTITIEGTLKGDAFGQEKVIVKKSGHMIGDITAPQVSMEDGAKFKGSIDMDVNRPAASAPQKDTESAAVFKLDTASSKPSFNQSSDSK